MNEKKTENTNVEVQAKLKTDHVNTEKPGDFWLGMGLFLIMNFILWKSGAYVMNLDYINENYSILLYKAENFQLPFGALVLISLFLLGILINVITILFLIIKKRSRLLLGMMSVIPVAFALYIIFSIIVFIGWVINT